MSAAKRARLRHAEENAAREVHQRKQNLRAADLAKSGAAKPDRRKLNRRAAAPIWRENLLGQIESLHPKQKVPMKKTGKGHKHGLTESQSEPKRIHLLLMTGPESNDNEPT